ncbi:MAG: amidohydrolase [Methylobacteriaceae bacterium]|nr:amidohydrolase [Methylobacteriaceae bacterium]
MSFVIDVHAHYVSQNLIDEAARNGTCYGVRVEEHGDGSQRIVFDNGTRLRPFFTELCDLAARVPKLKDWGIDRQLLSTWTDMAGDFLSPEHAIRWSRLQNETLAAAAAEHSPMFEAMGTLPLQHVEGCLAELDYLAKDLGMRSVEISTNINGRDLDGAEYRPVWKRICDLNLLVLLHPGFIPLGPQRLDRYFLNNIVGFPTDTTIAASRLLFSGLFSELPDLKICLAHGGGFLPYQIGRFDRGFAAHPACRAGIDLAPSQIMRRFYFDTLTHGDAALRFLFDVADRQRILFGTDYPFEMLDEMGPARVTGVPGLSAADVDHALGINAAKALGEEPPAGSPRNATNEAATPGDVRT